MPADDENIIELLGPREVIGQAISLLMVRHVVSRDAAFEILVQASSNSKCRVRDIAASIVHEVGA